MGQNASPTYGQNSDLSSERHPCLYIYDKIAQMGVGDVKILERFLEGFSCLQVDRNKAAYAFLLHCDAI